MGFGLVTAAIVALASVALSLQFSVTHVPNFFHGELLTYGAYGALVAQALTNNLFIDAAMAMVVGAVTAWASNRFVLQSFIKAGTRPIYLLIVTAGLALVLQNGLAFFFGGTPRNIQLPATITDPYHIGPFVWTQVDMIVIGAAVVAVSMLYLVLQYTKFGRTQRAVADVPELARVSGINVTRLINQTWLISGLLAGLAGISLAMIGGGTIQPAIGFNFLLVVFAAAILGGIGKPYGALLGAIIIGIATEVWAAYFNAAYKTSLAVAVLIVVLLFRPNGLVGSVREIV